MELLWEVSVLTFYASFQKKNRISIISSLLINYQPQ